MSIRILCCLLCFQAYLFGQNSYVFNRFSTADGLNTNKVNNVDTNNASGGLVNKIDAPSNGTNDTRSNKTNTVNQEESKIKPVANNVDNSGVLKKKDSTDNSSNQ